MHKLIVTDEFLFPNTESNESKILFPVPSEFSYLNVTSMNRYQILFTVASGFISHSSKYVHHID